MVTDLHNHVIPGVDDGAYDADESREGVEALRRQGVGRIVATPHIDASVTIDPSALERRLRELDQGWAELQAVVPDDGALTLGRGTEVRLDEPDPDLSDPRLRLAGGPTVLVEFPYLVIPPRSAAVLRGIADAGYQPLLSHPERYDGLWGRDLAVARSWIDAGAWLQVNAGSLAGEYGSDVEERAWKILNQGLAHCLASDYHSHGTPLVERARSLILDRGGEAQTRLLMEENPERLLRGDAPLPVAPIRGRPGPMASLKRWIRARSSTG